jgi:hypothetical protein
VAIADSAVTEQVLGNGIVDQLCGRNGSKVLLWGNTLPDGFIQSPYMLKLADFGQIKDTKYTIDHTKLAPGFKIPFSCYASTNDSYYSDFTFSGENIEDNSIGSYQIMPRSLNGQRLCFFDGSGQSERPTLARGINELLEDGSIGIENLPPDYRAKLGL